MELDTTRVVIYLYNFSRSDVVGLNSVLNFSETPKDFTIFGMQI
jgi:hypothetical protein